MADNEGILGGALASPLLLIGILYYLAENRPDYIGFKSGKELLGIGFGNASADYITSQVKGMVGGLGLSDEMVEALAGAGIVKFGGRVHPVVPLLGQGVLIDVVENSLQESGMTLEKLLGGVLGGGSSSSSSGSSSSSSSSSSSQESSPSTDQQWVTP